MGKAPKTSVKIGFLTSSDVRKQNLTATLQTGHFWASMNLSQFPCIKIKWLRCKFSGYTAHHPIAFEDVQGRLPALDKFFVNCTNLPQAHSDGVYAICCIFMLDMAY